MSIAIRGVEIFAAGLHRNEEYTIQDLDDMIAAFRKQDFRPALKIGHTRDYPGAPAYGWVTNLRRVGRKLIADFESMHSSVVKAIRDRCYDRVSCEIYHGIQRGTKFFRRALKGVALLGAEVPGIPDLVPLHKIDFVDRGPDAHAFVQPFHVDYEPEDSPGAAVHRAVRRYQSAHPGMSYADAMKAAFDPNLSGHRAYAAGPSGREVERAPQDRDRGEAGRNVHLWVTREMRVERGLGYSAALKRVLTDDPDLAADYGGIRVSDD